MRKVKLFQFLACKRKRFFFRLFITHSFTIIYNPGICPHCGNHFNRLKQHIIYKHTTEKPFKCQKCDFAHALPKGKVSILGVESLLPFSYWVITNLRGNCRYVELLFGSQEPEKIGHNLWMFALLILIAKDLQLEIHGTSINLLLKPLIWRKS